MIDDLDILDGHVHCYQRERLGQLVDDITYTGAGQFCALVTDRNDWETPGLQWTNALWLKQSMPDGAFVFGGLTWALALRPSTRNCRN